MVLIMLLLLVGGGVYTMLHLPIEAFPDLTNNQVVVITEAPGLSPTEVEQLVTFPVETALLGMPKTETVRSISKLGLSIVTVIFADSVNTYLARQIVSERLGEVRGQIPPNLQPRLGPLATAFGEVYQYTLQGKQASLMDLKTLHDWQVRYSLRTVPGVSEINSWGGETKQYTVEVDPVALRRFDLTLHEVLQRVTDNNTNFGGGFVEHAEEQYTVRGLGRAQGIDDLERVVVRAKNGVPVLLRDVARVVLRPLARQGAILRDAKGESVSGMVIILKGENGRAVIDRVKKQIAGLKLPNGVKLLPFYDQSEVIDGTLHTVRKNLLEAGALVILVLLVFLGNWRAALIVATVIPLSMLFGFLGMAAFGVSANLMSLGAIDFGMIVDGAVVMVENAVRKLEGKPDAERKQVIRDAAREVARPIVFAVAIIIAVYLPIFTLQGLEGRMFRPMAVTVCSALGGSLFIALTAVPVLCSFALRGTKAAEHDGWFARFRDRYKRALGWVLGHRWPVLGVALVAVVIALTSVKFIGTEFMPKLDEGSIVVTSRKLPGISLTESVQIGKEIERVIRGFPEIASVVTKLGRPDLATEAMGVYESDSYVTLAPANQWKCCKSKDELVGKLAQELNQIPGVAYNFTQPMEMRMDEVVTGIRGDLALKIFGEDIEVLDHLGDLTLAQIADTPGAFGAQKEVTGGVAELRVEANRSELGRYGMNVSDVQEVVETMIGGRQVSEIIQGQRRFPVAVRLPEALRNDIDGLAGLLMTAPGGERVRLDQVAKVRVVRGPEIINRENAQRRVVVQSSVRGTDLGTFVKTALARVNSNVKIPAGYSLVWGGQFENQQRANQRLIIVLPVSILVIFGLLYATFQNFKQALLILLIVPFALVGGIAALWLRGLNLNLSASIGFIALFGVAVLNGVVMVSHINTLRKEGKQREEAVREGAADRLRPVLMTALVASLGFIPMALSTSTGSEVQRPLATVVIGGLMTATLLTLFLLPLLYGWFSPKEQA